MPNLICFGDSITRGESDSVAGGWVDRLKAFAIRKFTETHTNEVCVFNLGIGGECTKGLEERFQHEMQTRLAEDGKTVVTLGYGANDVVNNGKGFVTSLETYLSRLEACIKFAKSHNAEPVIINVLPISEVIDGKLNELGKRRKNADIEIFNEHLLQLSRQHSVVLLDVATPFKKNKEGLLSSDGVHPNAEGHQLIFDTVLAGLNNFGLFD